MDTFDTNAALDGQKKELTLSIHRTLAHSYTFFFLFFLVGAYLYVAFPWKLSTNGWTGPVGYLLLFLATLLIFWAQNTSKNLKQETPSLEHFCRGPYCFSRSPTHWGLFILMLGFGVVMNSVWITGLAIVAFVFTKIVFIRKEEKALAAKYGAPYVEYQKKVKL